MRIVRKSTFETNSSSAHSLTFKREDIKEIPNYQGKELVLDLLEYSNKFSGEPDCPEIYTSFEDRLAYLLCSVFSYFSCPTNIRVEVPEGYVEYIKDLIEANKEFGYTDNFLVDVKEENGKWSDNFQIFELGWYSGIYLSSLVGFLKEKTKLESLKLKVHKEEFTYNQDWKNEQTTKVIQYGDEGVFDIRGLKLFGYYAVEFPIPLPLLYDSNWIDNFLFSKSTQVCISSTCNPLNTKLIPDWDNKKDGYYLSPQDRNNVKLIDLIKGYNIIYNSCQLSLDDRGLVKFGVSNRLGS